MKKASVFSLIIIAVVAMTSCVKRQYDEPPAVNIPVGHVLTIADLYQIYQDSVVAQGAVSYKFTGDYSVYGIISMDDKLGNIYKTAYMQDGGNAIDLHTLSSGGMYQGDSIRLYMKGLILMDYNGILQLDSVNVDKNIFKQATQKVITPKHVTIPELSAHISDPTYLCKLIIIDSVQFVDPDQTYADAANLVDRNCMLTDKDRNQIIVRNSSYSTFASDSLPKGNGSLIAILGKYGSDLQLYIRSTDELHMTNGRFADPYLDKNFDDGSVTSGGWVQKYVTAAIPWTIYGGNVASISNYSGGSNTACETWLISPAMDLSAAAGPTLTFKNAKNYTGPDMLCEISTDYDGSSAPSTATWTSVNYTKSTGGFAFVNSGNIDLSNYLSSSVYVAFVYSGTSSSGSTWEIDDVLVVEN